MLPNFARQKEVASIASFLSKNDADIHQVQNAIVKMFSQQVLPRLDQKWGIDRIFGKKLYEKYTSLGRKESFIQYISGLLVKSLIMVPPVIFLSIVANNALILLLAPIFSIVLFLLYVRDINRLYNQRKNTLIRDLPNLISKMMIALETGKSFLSVFQQVAEDCDPLLGEMLKRLIANAQNMPMRDALQLFAKEVDLPVMYDFISVINVGIEKGYKEAVPDLDSIKNDLRELRRLSLVEMTKGNPEKMNIFYTLLICHILIFLFLTFINLFSVLNSL
ncbi:hypothetical protein PMJ10TS2_79670 (plasmid) [Paenibacillus melissococcoides]